MDESEKKRVVLEVVQRRLIHHHDALWEEEKHYTWWIYIIFGALFYGLGVQWATPFYKSIFEVIGSLFGVFISLVGYGVVRREGTYFHTAGLDFDKANLNLRGEEKGEDERGGDQVKSDDQQDANLSHHRLLGLLPKLVGRILGGPRLEKSVGIRSYFQLTFLVSAILFLSFSVLALAFIWCGSIACPAILQARACP
jgi:hypothetical protein